MGLLDSLISSVTGNSNTSGDPGNPLATALNSLISQNGGIEGLMSKFSQGGLGEVFSSWVGLGENKPVNADQISKVLGSGQLASLASSLGVDQAQVSGFLADNLPKIIDKLTPSGQVQAGNDSSDGIAALLPSLLSSLGGGQGKA
ncbi:MAG: YidB family protein [Verrucomicrobiales bacterium]